MSKLPEPNRECDACGHVTLARTDTWRLVPEKAEGGMIVIAYQRQWRCDACATVTWLASGRQRPTLGD